MYYLDPLRCTHAVCFIVYRVINLSYVGVAVAARVAMNDKNTVKCHKKNQTEIALWRSRPRGVGGSDRVGLARATGDADGARETA
jgi:hypothetical protein